MKKASAVVGNAVRAKREALGISQEQLADLASLHRTYIGQVERGETNISLANLVRIADALSVRVRDLVRDL